MPAVEYVKHLLECRCILPQFKHIEPPRWHCFVAFSEVNEKGEVIPGFVQCNNCGIVHKVVEVGISTLINKDDTSCLPNLEDIKSGLPDKLVTLLTKADCDLPTYQEVLFILEHKLWGKAVVLNKEVVDNTLVGKYILILGETLWKVNSFQEEINE